MQYQFSDILQKSLTPSIFSSPSGTILLQFHFVARLALGYVSKTVKIHN